VRCCTVLQLSRESEGNPRGHAPEAIVLRVVEGGYSGILEEVLVALEIELEPEWAAEISYRYAGTPFREFDVACDVRPEMRCDSPTAHGQVRPSMRRQAR
jgi:hypothetical protein